MTKPLDPTGLKRLHRGWRRRTERRLALVLDRVGTPANVGTLLRTAAALGVERVWLAGATPGPEHAGVARTALGTTRYLTVEAVQDAEAARRAAVAAGFTTVGVELTGEAVPLFAWLADRSPTEALCLFVGHEDHGVAPRVLEHLDAVCFLPQVGKVGSLNVAHAGAIALWEARRAEWTAGPHAPSGQDAVDR